MKKHRLILTLVLAIIVMGILIFLNGCDKTVKPSADKELANQTELAMQEANRQVGMPAIVNFQEKKIMKQIYELRDQEDYICYAYLFNAFTGEVGQFIGKCIGYGLPYSTQFSNPEKVVSGGRMLGYTASTVESILAIPQPEPNGLFMPEGLSATWLLLIDPETNEPRPVYIEPEILVSPFPLNTK